MSFVPPIGHFNFARIGHYYFALTKTLSITLTKDLIKHYTNNELIIIFKGGLK